METKEIEFSKLRHAYVTVKTFLETESFESVKSLDTKIVADLKLTGDDNFELLEKFVTKFELDYKNFKYDDHFHTENELWGNSALLGNLLNLSIWLPIATIKLLTFNKIKVDGPKIFEPSRQVSDMTFRDLVTWYVEKEYVPVDNVNFKIKLTTND
jgi:hypothetical protein